MGLPPHVTTSSVGAAAQNAVFVGVLLGLVASAAFLTHAVVCRGLVGQFWKALTSKLHWPDPAMREEVMRKLRIESRYYACCINLGVMAYSCLNCGIMVFGIASGASRWMTIWQDVVWIWQTIATIPCQLALRHRQNHSVVIAVFVNLFVSNTLFVSAGPADQVKFVSVAGFSVFGRLLFSLACMRLPVVACLTVLHFLCVCAAFARTRASGAEDGGSQDFQAFVISEFIGDSIIILGTMVWEHFARLRVLHEIQASVMQNKNDASRALLNIVCDATTELDGQLQVVDESPRLASLLQHGCDRSLRGWNVLQFVVEEDRQLFTDRISSTPDECTANVFHVRVRDGISNIISLEVFHVPVAGYLRPDSHLIGVREYADATENVGSLSFARKPSPKRNGKRGVRDASEGTASKRAHRADADQGGAPHGSWSSSSSLSSAGGPSRGAGEVAAWIEVRSERWEIHSCSPGFELFWGSGSRGRRSTHGARGLLEWVRPDQREPLISWVQASYQEMRALRNTGPGQGPAGRCNANPIYFRPPSLWHVPAKVAYVASVAIALPEEHQNQSTLAKLAFSDIRVMQQSSDVRGTVSV